MDIVLHYNKDTAMLTAANRWTTGAYACSISNVAGTGKLTCGDIDPTTGSVQVVGSKTIDSKRQENGLVVAVPMLLQKSKGIWTAGIFRASNPYP